MQFLVAASSANTCGSSNSHLASIQDLKNKILDNSSANFPTFCIWNRMDRFSTGYKSDVRSKYLTLKNNNDMEGAVSLLAANESTSKNDIWSLSMAGHPDLKKRADQISFLVTCDSAADFNCKPASNTELENAFSAPFKKNNLYIPEYKPLKESKKSALTERLGACTIFSKGGINSCRKNISKIEELMEIQDFIADQNTPRPFSSVESKPIFSMGMGSAEAPITSSMVTAAPIVKNVLTDPNITEGLRIAALKMLKKQRLPTSQDSNLFDDIKTSMIEAGLSASSAEEKTWDVMAALATSGPNFAKRWSRNSLAHKMDIKNISDNPNAFSLQTIAEAIPKLDTLKASEQNGKIYSLPNGIEFPCDIGKSYHFWMTAFLARKLSKEGSSIESASSSAYIANLGYQMRRELYAGSNLNMDSLERFGATENGIRMDLLLASSGAKFGASSASNGSYKVDLTQKYREAVKQSSSSSISMTSAIGSLLPGLPGKAATFIDRIQPLTIFESMK